MKRYEPECQSGTLFLVSGDDRVEVGAIDDVVDAMGGDTFTIRYDEEQRKQPWLDADDGTLDVDVRETVMTLSHTEELVSDLRGYDMDTTRYGLPTRTYRFADMLAGVLEQQGESV